VDVSWLGHSCFRLKGRAVTVVTDPYPPSVGPRLRLEADVVTVSHGHECHSWTEAAKDAFVIDTPGEYEVSGCVVRGLPSFHDDQRGALRGRNTVFVIELDEVRVCHLGDLGHRLDDDVVDRLGKVDVLLVPAGGTSALDGAGAAEVARAIEPRFVVPMHYATPSIRKALAPVERFLKEMSVTEVASQPRLSVQASAGEVEPKVVLLEPRA
jgi:L-ascorbate metabolism protein UlaG (beta-lactamase superfamily)